MVHVMLAISSMSKTDFTIGFSKLLMVFVSSSLSQLLIVELD